MSEQLFDLGGPPPKESAPRLTPDERRKRDDRRLLARGIHPASKFRVRVSDGSAFVCADCVHHEIEFTTVHKCTSPPGGALTKGTWPACEMFALRRARPGLQ